MVLGKNGIITKAQIAKIETRGATVEEARDMWRLNKETAKSSGGDTTAQTLEELIDSLVKQKQLTEDEKDIILGNEEKGIEAQYQVTIGSRTISFKEEGQITLVEMFKLVQKDNCDGTNCTKPEEHLHIGDYVDYKNPTSGKYIVPKLEDDEFGNDAVFEITNTKNQLNWQVLGLADDEKSIKIIASTPMKAESALWNGPYLTNDMISNAILNEASGLYKNNYAKEARSVSIDDLIALFGENIIEKGCINEIEKVEKEEVEDGEVYKYTQYHIKSVEATPSIKLIFDNTHLDAGNNFTNYEKIVGRTFYVTGDPIRMIMTDTTHNSGEDDISIERFALWDAESDTCYGAVRPVVILNSDVTKNQINKIDAKKEEKWSNSINWYTRSLLGDYFEYEER